MRQGNLHDHQSTAWLTIKHGIIHCKRNYKPVRHIVKWIHGDLPIKNLWWTRFCSLSGLKISHRRTEEFVGLVRSCATNEYSRAPGLLRYLIHTLREASFDEREYVCVRVWACTRAHVCMCVWMRVLCAATATTAFLAQPGWRTRKSFVESVNKSEFVNISFKDVDSQSASSYASIWPKCRNAVWTLIVFIQETNRPQNPKIQCFEPLLTVPYCNVISGEAIPSTVTTVSSFPGLSS